MANLQVTFHSDVLVRSRQRLRTPTKAIVGAASARPCGVVFEPTGATKSGRAAPIAPTRDGGHDPNVEMPMDVREGGDEQANLPRRYSQPVQEFRVMGVPTPQSAADVLLGERGVTRREAEVLRALGRRLTNAEIAAALYVSERTVESHVSALLRKLEASNRFDLATIAASLAQQRAVGPQLVPPMLELLADPSSFVGRAVERERLRDLWQRASRGCVVVGLVTGEAGIGKSRLVAEFAVETSQMGGRVLLGSCDEDLGVPYGPFVEVISADAAQLPDDELFRRVGSSSAVSSLARLMPELGLRLGTVASASSGGHASDAVEQAVLHQALHAYLAHTALVAPLLVVLEDLHWSSSATRAAMRHMARSGTAAPMLLIATSRDEPPDLDEGLRTFFGDLERLPTVERVSLRGLASIEVWELLSTTGADVDVDQVTADTGGNPLLIAEVAATGDVHFSSVSSLLSSRYKRLSPRDLAVIDIASIVGTEFDADLVAAALDRDLESVLEALERCELAGLVVAEPAGRGRFRFVHALFRTVRHDQLSSSAHTRLHNRVARALEARVDDPRTLPDLARHACLAAPLGDLGAAVTWSTRAAEAARRALAFDEAADHYRRALAVTELFTPRDEQLSLRLRIDLGSVLFQQARPEGRELLRAAADEARTRRDSDALAAVALTMPSAATRSYGGHVDEELAAWSRAALEVCPTGPSPTRGKLLAELAVQTMAADLEGSRTIARDAVAMARTIDDPVTLGWALGAYLTLIQEPACAAERAEIANEIIAIGRDIDDVGCELDGLNSLIVVHREAGDLVHSDALCNRYDRILSDRPAALHRLISSSFQATRTFLAGDLDSTERLAEELLVLAPDAGFDAINWYGPQLLVVRHNQGRIGELLPLLEEASRSQPGHKAYRVVLAGALARTGRYDEAGVVLAGLAADNYEMPHSYDWFSGTVELADVADLLDNRELAAIVLERLRPFGGRIADHATGVTRPADQAIAQLELSLGQPENAADAAERATAASRQRGTPVFLGRELVLLSLARTRAGRDVQDSGNLLAEALDIAEFTGADLIRQEARRYGLI
jgi:DNA-binding CsgD family transcriptional regulator/tetratricopeptide (TPR) repeat protein